MYILEEKILPVAQKIKTIRKSLDLRQEELTNGTISRSLISYIENGKVELTKDTAKVIAECLQEVLNKKNIPYKIDADYLMRDNMTQADFLLDKHIKELQKYKDEKDEVNFVSELRRIEDILEQWDLPQKRIIFYELAADFYYERNRLNDSYIYYIKCLENNIKLNDGHNYAKILTKIGRCCIKMRKYWQAIKYNDYALAVLSSNKIEDDNLHKRCMFNTALAYRSLNCYDESLESIDKLEELYNDFTPTESLDILMLKGNCYRNKGDLETSERIYNKALDISKMEKKHHITSMIYTNISALYVKRNDIERAIKYDKESLKISEQIKDKKISKDLLSLGGKYKVLKQFDLAEKYLLRGIKETNRKKDLRTYVKLTTELLDIYIQTNEYYLVSNLVDEIQMISYEHRAENKRPEIEEIDIFLLKAVDFLVESDANRSRELLKILLERKGVK